MSKILIIEDEEAIADLEKDYLELSGFSALSLRLLAASFRLPSSLLLRFLPSESFFP